MEPHDALSFINMPLLTYIHEIDNAVLLIHGENAHSRYFSEDAFKRLKGNNKELLIVPTPTTPTFTTGRFRLTNWKHFSSQTSNKIKT